MRVMVIGGGGREHALCAKLASSSGVEALLCAPGNAGTAMIAENLAIEPSDIEGVVAACRERSVDLVVVGPEAPLVAGLGDALDEAGIAAFGPGREAARLEGSKVFAKRFMLTHGVPTAAAEIFDDPDRAITHLGQKGRPLVVKADGLAAGKGVVVPETVEHAIDAVERIMRQRVFGDAGARIVLEERLTGQEVSYHVLCDGKRFLPLAAAQDHKRVGEGDTGPNTGGMGAYSPPPVVTPEVERRILERVVEPTFAGLTAEGIVFRGVLFIGLMISDEGQPSVIEYNVRFGDPEAQVLMARMRGDLLPLLSGVARGELRDLETAFEAPAALCVVLASEGYPASYPKGRPISGLDDVASLPGVSVSHAGTRREGERLVTSGGRVLSVTAVGDDVDHAAERAYRAVGSIHFDGMHYRRDIGWRSRSRGSF